MVTRAATNVRFANVSIQINRLFTATSFWNVENQEGLTIVFDSIFSNTNHLINPHISPMDAKITPDLCFQRVPATESIAVTMVEGARTRWEHKDK